MLLLHEEQPFVVVLEVSLCVILSKENKFFHFSIL